jgi:transposase InsO family protein
MVMK